MPPLPAAWFRSVPGPILLLGVGLLLLGPGGLGAQTLGVNLGDSARVAPGSRFAVPVGVDLTSAGSLTLASLQATATWGASRLTLDSVRAVPASGFSVTANAGSGSVVFNAFNATALAASGPVATLYFTAAGTAGSTRLALAPSAAGTEASQDILARIIPRPLDNLVMSYVSYAASSSHQGYVRIRVP